jgi:hypothetical protein
MPPAVSPELTSKFDLHSEEPGHREPVLITCEHPAQHEGLVGAGLDVRFVSRDGRIVAGLLDRAALGRLAELPGIVRIEPDTEMYALER